jgi:hypothetical protein
LGLADFLVFGLKEQIHAGSDLFLGVDKNGT